MNKTDQSYQSIVDELATELLDRQPNELIVHPDYGTHRRQVSDDMAEVGFWHYPFSDDKHHIVFKTSRRVFLFLYRSYVNGVVFGRNTPPRLMTPEEAGDYD
ncbi:MAG: hypothetical protein Rubg2KO_02560 [Rubricoccaceae bacterium]